MPTRTAAHDVWAALSGAPECLEALRISGDGGLDSVYPVTDLACDTVGLAGSAIAELVRASTGRLPSVDVDRRLASFWFGNSLRPIGWKVPPVWHPIAGDYQTSDGWIRIHANMPHHRRIALDVLGCEPDRASAERAVATWRAETLEQAIVDRGGCAARMRTREEWAAHPQGSAVEHEPVLHVERRPVGPPPGWSVPASRPLAGIRVLDLTRVLAGPIATRFLAGFGADVLRIDPPAWEEPAIVPEVTLGKRCARLDLRDASGRETLARLLAQADVLLHGYRGDALARLGFDADQREAMRPGLVDVSLTAYGWTGPWRTRRGFDSLVQMSSGICDAGMRLTDAAKPVSLPVQALDHATGYLLAAAAVRGLVERYTTGGGWRARASLARTAALLVSGGEHPNQDGLAPETPDDVADPIEQTGWGPARRLAPPLRIDAAPMAWDRPAGPLGTSAPSWD